MTLDLFEIGGQIEQMGALLHESRDARRERWERALEWFHHIAGDWEALAARARASTAAAPLEALDAHHEPPATPQSYEVVATDGSSIEPDRHGPAMCAVINVGRVRIRYGDAPAATLDSRPQLFYTAEQLYVEQAGRRVLLSGQLLDVRRSVAEMRALGEIAGATSEPGLPRVALADGLLTIWRQDWAGADASELTAQFTAALEALYALHLPVAAYTSRPNSRFVMDLVRLEAECRAGGSACKLHCGGAACALDDLVDRDLFGDLPPGHRSGLFEVVGRDSDRYGKRHRTHFFYLAAPFEIARIEIPAWVAQDQAALELVHAVIGDQAERGQGYPVALARAHEQAIISGQDRWAFQQLVVEALARFGLPTGLSEKQSSKDIHAV